MIFLLGAQARTYSESGPGSRAPITQFGAAWEEAFRGLLDKGLECADRPCYEMYHDDCRGKTCRFDICIPLMK